MSQSLQEGTYNADALTSWGRRIGILGLFGFQEVAATTEKQQRDRERLRRRILHMGPLLLL